MHVPHDESPELQHRALTALDWQEISNLSATILFLQRGHWHRLVPPVLLVELDLYRNILQEACRRGVPPILDDVRKCLRSLLDGEEYPILESLLAQTPEFAEGNLHRLGQPPQSLIETWH